MELRRFHRLLANAECETGGQLGAILRSDSIAGRSGGAQLIIWDFTGGTKRNI